MNLQKAVELFTPYANAILGDETGKEAERINSLVIETLGGKESDWLFDNWDSVLRKLEEL